jgi:ABC-type antimicrobial peptide transport system permease subunit
VAAAGSDGWLEIVGVAGNTPNRGLSEAVVPAVYVPYTLMMGDSMQLVLRTTGAPMTMVRAVREQIRAVDAGQPVGKAQTAEELLRAEGWAREQFTASLFLVFAMLALALAATGLYSVVAYATTLRKREFGIRIALGAQRTHLVGLVLRAAAKSVGAGAVVGVALSIASGFRDASTLGVVVVLLLVAAGVAALVPACRAANRTSVPGSG